jgi:hypothetical protein
MEKMEKRLEEEKWSEWHTQQHQQRQGLELWRHSNSGGGCGKEEPAVLWKEITSQSLLFVAPEDFPRWLY